MMPSMYLNPSTNKLYTYAYDANTSESGVVCANLTTPSAPFCGFTPLVAAGSTTRRSGPSEPYISNGVVWGGNFYAFNGQSGAPSGDGDTLMCFNIATEAACPDQPFHFDLGVTSVSTTDNAMAAINVVGGNIFVRLLGTASATGSESLACFNAVAKSQCVGAWPAVIDPSLATKATAIMPLGDGSGAPTGVCLPLSDSSISCWGFGGAAVQQMHRVGGDRDGFGGLAEDRGRAGQQQKGKRKGAHVKCYITFYGAQASGARHPAPVSAQYAISNGLFPGGGDG
jgi:hypothetical protein